MKYFYYLILSALVFCGCSEKNLSATGEDAVFLQMPEQEQPKTTKSLLPLQIGYSWEMQSRGNEKFHKDVITVEKVVTINNVEGYLLRLERDGTLWRQEIYQSNDKGLSLLAFGEKKRELLVLSPPFPLAVNPVQTGNYSTWEGKIGFGKQSFRAKGFTRVTCIETIQTNTGRFQCYRFDSIISMNNAGGRTLHFPTIRWLSEKTGFIQRSFADEGKPAIQILDRFRASGS